MERLRIGIGSDDGETLAVSHLGDTEGFLIYDLTRQQEPNFIERRTNEVRDMEHAGLSKMKAVLAILHDVDVLVASRNSPNFRRMAATSAHQPVVVHRQQVGDAVQILLQHYDRLAALVHARHGGQRHGDVLELG